jgi:hypothetical protein
MDFAKELLRRMADEAQQEMDRPKISRIGEIEVLREGLRLLNTAHNFSPGMIVQQKPGCENYKTLSDNGVAIVVEVLAEPIIISREDDLGGMNFRTPMDMIIGEYSSDGNFCLFYVDKRRFEPVE